MLNEKLVHTRQEEIKMTGITVNPPGNFLSKVIWLYNCIRGTSLGPEMIALYVSKEARACLKYAEYLDFFMHYFGCIFLIFAADLQKEVYIRILLLAPVFLHHLHIAFWFYVVAYPLRCMIPIALLIPTNTDEAIDGLMNNFFTIKATEQLSYSCTTEQSAVFVQAKVEGQIKFMLYNKTWKNKCLRIISYLNVLVHLLPLVLVLLFPGSFINNGGVAVLAYVFFIFFYQLIMWSYLSCLADFCENILQLFSCCGCFHLSLKMTENIINQLRDGIEAKNLEQAINIYPIYCTCGKFWWRL